jgi:hypothetical protein
MRDWHGCGKLKPCLCHGITFVIPAPSSRAGKSILGCARPLTDVSVCQLRLPTDSFLHGVLPEALLESHKFWMDDNDCLRESTTIITAAIPHAHDRRRLPSSSMSLEADRT